MSQAAVPVRFSRTTQRMHFLTVQHPPASASVTPESSHFCATFSTSCDLESFTISLDGVPAIARAKAFYCRLSRLCEAAQGRDRGTRGLLATDC